MMLPLCIFKLLNFKYVALSLVMYAYVSLFGKQLNAVLYSSRYVVYQLLLFIIIVQWQDFELANIKCHSFNLKVNEYVI